MTVELEISAEGALGRIALNRPQAINALSRGMIEGIVETLERWRDDSSIGAVLFVGNGAKGFCSGGDVRAARALVIEGRPADADAYFAAEYGMNRLIATFPKPLVALTHGIVMGGGIGIAGHCTFRLTQPGARFAMPESAIGFFADVGVSAVLAKTTLNRALLFAMSGVSVGPPDALALGLADAMIDPAWVATLPADLAAAAASSRPLDAIGRLIGAHSMTAGNAVFCTLADQLPDTEPRSPGEFVSRVGAVPALSEVAALLQTRCPGSLVATFQGQLAARRLMDVGRTLDMDLRLARVMARRPDFAEGVRAVLVDKDQTPRWSPATLAAFEAQADAAPILAALESP